MGDADLPPLVFHQRAQEVFAGVLANVRTDQLGNPTPCEGWDVRAVIDHVIQGNVRVQQRAGREPEPLPDDDLVAAHAASAAGAQATFASPDGLTRIFELPIGALPGAAFLAIRAGDAITHAWDVAVATGQSTDLDAEVAAQALASAQRFMSDALRGEDRPFGPEQASDPSAAVADRLAAYLGHRRTGPVLYIDRSDVHENCWNDLRLGVRALAAFVDAHQPQMAVYSVYLDEDTLQMTVMSVHPSSASLERHIEVGGPEFQKLAPFLTLREIEVFGPLSERALELVRQKAAALGEGGRVMLHEQFAGFSRLGG